MNSYNLISIIGNTATGKTKIAVNLAYRINSEIISADSRQVYKGMDLGTGKDLSEYKVSNTEIPYHLIDIKEPGYEYNVFEFQKDFIKTYDEIRSRGKIPIMCGGSGMYVDSVLRNYELLKVPENKNLRAELEGKSLEELKEILSKSRDLHNTTDISDKERAIKAIEIDDYYLKNPQNKIEFPKINSLNIGVKLSREENRAYISRRLEQRLKEGMVEEVENLLKSGYTAEQLMFYGLEYRYITMYLKGEIDFDNMKSTLETKIHQFMKRQSTWWRRMEKNGVEINWIDAKKPLSENIEFIINKIRNTKN